MMPLKTLERIQYNVYVTKIYVTPDNTSSTLSVFVDKFTEFAVNIFSCSLTFVCDGSNSHDCSFLLSPGRQNVVDFPPSLDVQLGNFHK